MRCPHCQSETVVKNGTRRLHDNRIVQDYRCRSCAHNFNDRTGTPMTRLRTPSSVVEYAHDSPYCDVQIAQFQRFSGSPTLTNQCPGDRFRTCERLKRYAQAVKGTLFESQDLVNEIDLVYRYPLRKTATDQLNRQLKSGIDNAQLADLVVALYQDERLCLVQESEGDREPQIICSMGLFQPK